MEKNDFVSKPTKKEILSLIQEGYKILSRILKDNNHFNIYRKACLECIKENHKDTPYRDYLKLSPIECLYGLFETQKYHISNWSIHRNVQLGSFDEWENGFSKNEIVKYRSTPNIYMYLIMIVGMQLNLYGAQLNFGYFYDDFQIFKKEIIKQKNL